MPTNPFLVPPRTSSINVRTGDTGNNRRDHKTRSMHKAQKILGTVDIALDNDYHRRPDKRASRSAGYLNARETTHQHGDEQEASRPASVRVQSFSPQLGQEYRDQADSTSAFAQLSRKLHLPGSSSGMNSRSGSRGNTADSSASPGKDHAAAADSRTVPEGGLNPAFKQPKGPMKDTKRKGRPPRIDLSLLFPKPQTSSTTLLSPQRMVTSPSAVSFTSELPAEHHTLKAYKSESRLAGKRLTKAPPRQRALSRPEDNTLPLDDLSSQTATQRPPSVYNPTMERTVRTTDMDRALVKNLDAAPTPRSPERAFHYNQMNFSLRGREQLLRSDSSFATAKSGGSAHSSQRTLRDPALAKSLKDGPELEPSPFQFGLPDEAPRSKGNSMSKKNSRSTLKNRDLTTSSVLCLSSSEDEDDEPQPAKSQSVPAKNRRDSVSTYGGYEAEICTAAAAHTIRGTLRSVERPSSSNTKSSRASSKHLRAPPSANGNNQSRRSSGTPALLEPDFLHSDPIFDQSKVQTRASGLSQKEVNRRSRLIAVTRQEERLLDLMRQRQGKITPSILNENIEVDRRSMFSNFSGPSRNSYYCSDTSFLRLSACIPPDSARASQVTMKYKDTAALTPTATDFEADETAIKSVPSPQASLSSKSLPSPATSTTSPLTPTLPIHRFSPLPSQKPPPRLPPPPIPDLQRSHSRRRTDSSGAIVLDNPAEDTRQSGEFPVWALGWANDNNNLTAVH
ncbi:hypothetical protein BDW60DRAFT_176586 [Aspergillus nidulans var. acristatus]